MGEGGGWEKEGGGEEKVGEWGSEIRKVGVGEGRWGSRKGQSREETRTLRRRGRPICRLLHERSLGEGALVEVCLFVGGLWKGGGGGSTYATRRCT